MLLVRHRNNDKNDIILEGTESEIVAEIKKLGLTDHHDSFFYKEYSDLGLLGEDHYDYYCMYNDAKELDKAIESLNDDVVVGMDEDGHFHAIELKHREVVIKHITKTLCDQMADEGDVALEEAEVDNTEQLLECTFDQYKTFVNFFIQRGILEITKLK